MTNYFIEVFECSVHVLDHTVVPAQAAKGHTRLPHTPQQLQCSSVPWTGLGQQTGGYP